MQLSVMSLKKPKLRLQEHARASTFTCQSFNYFNIVIYISFCSKGCFSKRFGKTANKDHNTANTG